MSPGYNAAPQGMFIKFNLNIEILVLENFTPFRKYNTSEYYIKTFKKQKAHSKNFYVVTTCFV